MGDRLARAQTIYVFFVRPWNSDTVAMPSHIRTRSPKYLIHGSARRRNISCFCIQQHSRLYYYLFAATTRAKEKKEGTRNRLYVAIGYSRLRCVGVCACERLLFHRRHTLSSCLAYPLWTMDYAMTFACGINVYNTVTMRMPCGWWFIQSHFELLQFLDVVVNDIISLSLSFPFVRSFVLYLFPFLSFSFVTLRCNYFVVASLKLLCSLCSCFSAVFSFSFFFRFTFRTWVFLFAVFLLFSFTHHTHSPHIRFELAIAEHDTLFSTEGMKEKRARPIPCNEIANCV